jgi:hypothetical protein
MGSCRHENAATAVRHQVYLAPTASSAAQACISATTATHHAAIVGGSPSPWQPVLQHPWHWLPQSPPSPHMLPLPRPATSTAAASTATTTTTTTASCACMRCSQRHDRPSLAQPTHPTPCPAHHMLPLHPGTATAAHTASRASTHQHLSPALSSLSCACTVKATSQKRTGGHYTTLTAASASAAAHSLTPGAAEPERYTAICRAAQQQAGRGRTCSVVLSNPSIDNILCLVR